MRGGHNKKGWFRKCANCPKEFWVFASRPDRKACSLACRDAVKLSERHDFERQLKRCARCEEWKPFSVFARAGGQKAGSHGMQAYCSPCSLAKSIEWAENNKQAKRAHRKKFQERHSEKLRVKARTLTPEKRAIKNSKAREWRKKNMDKVLMWNRLRNHRQRAAGKMPDRWAFSRMICAQDARCVYCKTLLSGPYHIDHKTPVSRGGTNDLENLQLLCVTCNLRKSRMTDEEFRRTYKLTEADLLAKTIEALHG